ncbi:MAG: 3-methyl-2-oxobutanoate hydroxymethyltransferase [Verrucomicrobiales bacterium]|jgi:3-methyl-2-oxobutanoate hydroxymethyltransferase|nr:3-methyl-2-oxobutanoate hydroxymethyltransferase [Verrucomicrobiales bacterium]HQZ28207.1 3-methyl-2-oxobutanoate hydroxymethyltransferase [Verrucomicrobiales bacterium]
MNPLPLSELCSRLVSPLSAITAYDYPSARLCDEAGIQLILVGDSLGMVVAGCPDTTSVTLDQMIYHTQMVRRGVTQALVISDLPINTYRSSEEAITSSRRLIEAGADAVKLEGGFGQLEKVKALRDEEIPICAHIGMLPQSVREEGGYKKKGKTVVEAQRLVDAAIALEECGAFAIVLESVVAEVAAEITRSLTIPTIGIGSGHECSGQIRVLHDVTGAYPWFVPPFATVHGNVAEVTRSALHAYLKEIGR